MTKNKKDTLIVKNLSHTYSDGGRKLEVLKKVNATFKSGQVYAIVGESGSGKTTLISLISALDEIQSGDVLFNGKSIKKIGVQQFRQHYVNVVFQSFNLIKYMTARENVEVGLDFAGYKGNEKSKAYELLKKVGIPRNLADNFVQSLSGGQQQRVAIARCMAGDVPIIVADEPTGNLDEKTKERIIQLFKKLANEGKIVIIVTHSQKVAKIANAVIYQMKDGNLKLKK